MGAEDPQVSAASIVKIEKPDEEEPFIPFAARMGATFLHGAAVTIHKAQGSQWDTVQVFAPDLFVAARMGRVEAGQPLWKRLAYVAITRASSGIGAATAQEFLKAGWKVGLLARRKDKLADVASGYDNALCLQADVTDAEAVDRAFSEFSDWAGHLDVLFNNAGQFGPSGPD
ncbi:Serine 3-dehydrogenase [Nymphon striatum]|nr:Serine 3-dehydrogenase [Nymphon striatum]